MEYPTYHRLAGICIRRETPTTGIHVEIPTENGKLLPTIHSPVVTPDEARFDEMVKNMEVVNEETYVAYLGTYFSLNRQKDKMLNDHRQRLYDAGKLKL